jgi:phosphatidylserine decarboxylase
VQKFDGQKIKLEKGEEMGRFKLGSTVVLCFPEDTIKFKQEIQATSPLMMGQALAD